MAKRTLLAILGLAVLAGGDFLIRLGFAPLPENQKPGKFPEELVFVRSKDDVVSGGVVFTAPKETAKPMAVVWIHGWGANFYLPSYVGIGRGGYYGYGRWGYGGGASAPPRPRRHHPPLHQSPP